MKKALLFVISTFLIGLIFSANAFAWTIFLSTDYQAGDTQATFNINLNLEADETIQINGYQLDFIFDSSELTYAGYTNTPVSPAIANFVGMPAVSEDNENLFLNFNAFAFMTIAPVSTSQVLGTITFDVSDTAVVDGLSSDLNFYLDSVNIGLWLDGVTEERNLDNFESYSIDVGTAAVPVPSALLLMGAGILGFAGLGRKPA